MIDKKLDRTVLDVQIPDWYGFSINDYITVNVYAYSLVCFPTNIPFQGVLIAQMLDILLPGGVLSRAGGAVAEGVRHGKDRNIERIRGALSAGNGILPLDGQWSGAVEVDARTALVQLLGDGNICVGRPSA